MNNIISLTLASTIFLLAGTKHAQAMPLQSRIEKLGLAYLIGCGGTTFSWFLLSLLGLPFNLQTLLLSALIVFSFGHFMPRAASPKITARSYTRFDQVLIVTIVFILAAALIIANYNAITAWDSMALYDFRAQAIVLNHDLRDITASSYYLSYPLFVSLMHAAVYFVGGSNPQAMHTLLFAAFLTVVYGRLSSWTSPRYALIGVGLNALIYEILMHSTIAYSNLPYTVFIVGGFLYAVSETQSSRGRFLILAALMAGFSTWVRNTEVFWLLVIIVIGWEAVLRRLWRPALVALFVFAVIRTSWVAYYQILVNNLAEPPLAPGSIFSLDTIRTIFKHSAKLRAYISQFLIQPYVGFWGMAIGLCVLSFIQPHSRIRQLTFVIMASLAIAILGSAVYSTFFPTWFEIGDSARRMLLFVAPLTLTTSLLAVYPHINGKNEN